MRLLLCVCDNIKYLMNSKCETLPEKIVELFDNPEHAQRIIKIIIQTLYNLGYEKSANALEQQSNIIYMKPQIIFLKQALPLQKYQQIEVFWQEHSIHVCASIKNIIKQLKCMKYLREGEIDRALIIIQQQTPDHQNSQNLSEFEKPAASNAKLSEKQKKYLQWNKTQERLAEELMVGDGTMPPEKTREMHEFIMDKSLESDLEPRALEKILMKFMQLEKLGLTSSLGFKVMDRGAENMMISHLLINPPNKVIEKTKSKTTKKITFIKFCPDSSSSSFHVESPVFLVVSGQKKNKFLTLWQLASNYNLSSFPNKKIKPLSQLQIEIPEDIISVSWCSSRPQFILTTSTSVFIYRIFKSKDNKKIEIQVMFRKKITQESGYRNIRLLCAQYNPLTNYIYIGSSSQLIKIYGSALDDEILTIKPFFRTRSIRFLFEFKIMLAASATKGVIVLYDLLKMREINKLDFNEIEQTQKCEIISLRVSTEEIQKEQGLTNPQNYSLSQDSQYLILVTQKIIYLIQIKYEERSEHEYQFHIMKKLNNPFPDDSQLSEVQSMLYAGKYLITLGNKEFHGFQLEDPLEKNKPINRPKKQHRWQCRNSFTFDIKENILISGNQELMMWGYQNEQKEEKPIEEENQSMYEDEQQSIQIQNLENLGVGSLSPSLRNLLVPSQPQIMPIQNPNNQSSSDNEVEDMDEEEDIAVEILSSDSDNYQDDFE